ncbi:hypothetical protein ACSBR2_040253 [Camellia fascicularis]
MKDLHASIPEDKSPTDSQALVPEEESHSNSQASIPEEKSPSDLQASVPEEKSPSVPEEKSHSKLKQIIDCIISHLIPRQSLQKFGIPSATELHEAGVKFKVNYLINTSKDVELLIKAKIIENWLSDNNDMSNIFNGLNKEVTINSKAYYVTALHKKLNDYCEIPSHKWKATLRQNYCNTP